MHILFGAGGTGGHLYPALAVAEALISRVPDIRITFTGRKDKIEGAKVPVFGFDFLPIDVESFSITPSIDLLKKATKIYSAKQQIIKFMKREMCDAVVVAGAYISLPPGLAASSLKKPLFCMESNVNPGKAIKYLTAHSTAIFTSFEDSRLFFPEKHRSKLVFTGNPVRSDFEKLPPKYEAKLNLGFNPDLPLVLLFGGSLGAESINNFVQNNLKLLNRNDFSVAWQTGSDDKYSMIVKDNIKSYKYIDNMALFYAAADLIVSRSGASTVSEQTLTGTPSILIPLPSASNNEQFKNAEIMKSVGAACLVQDKDIERDLLDLIFSVIFDKDKLHEMSKNAKKLSMPNAAETIADIILNMIKD
ncbi:MAG: undecaprenyldiphospho-muramoylpentapeptide beta-N-acetylglucosaminyltransferase [Candidatus Kapaibacterium sp.]